MTISRRFRRHLFWTAAIFAIILIYPRITPAQATAARTRITEAVDDTNLTVLKGNTHGLARAEFDRGAAPPGMPLKRMLLVLKRSPEQEATLQTLLVEQQDIASPNYHKWLTPEQFGQQFGASDADIQTVTSWLGSHGFQVTNVAKGRTVIEFSGTTSQVQEAFHTAIHKFVVNGEEHWANASDPQIPSALGSVVGGVATLHNFFKKPHVRYSAQVVSAKATAGKKPSMILSDGSHAVSPADFATIYNVSNSLRSPPGPSNGANITIAIVGRSNINLADVQNFRGVFGVGGTFNQNNIVLNGPDPGNLGGGEEFEAVLDASWSGAVAPSATVLFVVSESTETTDGLDLSEVYVVDNNLAPVMSESFGACEGQQVGAAEEMSEASIAEQAAAQGITFMASTGDAGAEGCDDPNSETKATGPIAVQVPAALPYTVAVGGTMFIENDNTFWNTTDTNTFESAKSFIPENVWNESCQTISACSPEVKAFAGVNILAGGGGASTIFSKPVWQTGVAGIPPANFRAVPDVALNAAVFHDGTVLCVASQGASCVVNNSGSFNLILVGGTSVAAPSFAGVMALVNEKTGQRQGQADFVLYRLAASETLASCNGSSSSPLPAVGCIFNDTTVGNNAVPGETGFGNANAQFQAGTGYDQGTGLGSVNVFNLLNQWSTARTKASTTTLTIPTPNAGHGVPVSVTVTVTGSGGPPTGDVSLIANTGTSASGQTGNIKLSTFSLTAGTVTGTTSSLPGGSYSVEAHYEGDSNFLPSDSGTVNVNIGMENSNTQVVVNFIDPNTGTITNNTKNFQYGSNYLIRMSVSGASGSCAGNVPGSTGCPTGNVTLKDGVNPLDGGTFALNSAGYAEDQLETLSLGAHTLNAAYSGDGSFNSSSSSDAVMVTQATTTMAATSSSSTIFSGASVTLTGTVNTQSFANAPTGTIQFLNGTTPVSGNVSLVGHAGSFTAFASLTGTVTTLLSTNPSMSPDISRRPIVLIPAAILSCVILTFLLYLLAASSAKRRGFAYIGLTFAAFLLAGMAACGGGGGGGGGAHTVVITVKYSGDTNYAASQSTVSIKIQ
ncbi:MAG: Ig-like domain repeat protein [Candidatus Acidiferrales bacterium]